MSGTVDISRQWSQMVADVKVWVCLVKSSQCFFTWFTWFTCKFACAAPHLMSLKFTAWHPPLTPQPRSIRQRLSGLHSLPLHGKSGWVAWVSMFWRTLQRHRKAHRRLGSSDHSESPLVHFTPAAGVKPDKGDFKRYIFINVLMKIR